MEICDNGHVVVVRQDGRIEVMQLNGGHLQSRIISFDAAFIEGVSTAEPNLLLVFGSSVYVKATNRGKNEIEVYNLCAQGNVSGPYAVQVGTPSLAPIFSLSVWLQMGVSFFVALTSVTVHIDPGLRSRLICCRRSFSNDVIRVPGVGFFFVVFLYLSYHSATCKLKAHHEKQQHKANYDCDYESNFHKCFTV
jgi:hypothetical protein